MDVIDYDIVGYYTFIKPARGQEDFLKKFGLEVEAEFQPHEEWSVTIAKTKDEERPQFVAMRDQSPLFCLVGDNREEVLNKADAAIESYLKLFRGEHGFNRN